MSAERARGRPAPARPRRTFVDTNILVYAHDASEHRRQPIAAALLRRLWNTRSGMVSTQVLTEFYNVVTRRLRVPLARRDARELVSRYAVWPVVQVDTPLILAASALEEEHSFSFWDALIVEAARRGGARVLASEDLQHGRRLDTLSIENPFAPDPIG
ncbi:MAG: PIN domain-containing protein [Miltoncostaeaceae bacterium]